MVFLTRFQAEALSIARGRQHPCFLQGTPGSKPGGSTGDVMPAIGEQFSLEDVMRVNGWLSARHALASLSGQHEAGELGTGQQRSHDGNSKTGLAGYRT